MPSLRAYTRLDLSGGVQAGVSHLLRKRNEGAADTNATLQVLSADDYWATIISDAAVNTRFQCLNFMEEFYVTGASDNNTYLTLQNVDSTLTSSTTRNVRFAPKAKFIADYQGGLYAMNVQVRS